MALRVLMAKKKLDETKKSLDEIRQKKAELELREADIEKAIEEANTDEEKAVVEEEIAKFETEKADLDNQEKALDDEVTKLENDLAEMETEQDAPAPVTETPVEERKDNNINMNTREIYNKMDVQERANFLADDGLQSWLGEIRSAIKEKRAITNVGLTIPTVVLPLLRANIEEWSKLYKHVLVRYVSGEARQNILAQYGEAIWTECCANLNELTLGFNDYSVDCFKIGGYYALCQANVADSDYDLAAEVVTALGQAIGKGLDKAILFGRNTATNSKMPLGAITSILQTSQPADYPATARTWVDLHETNVVSIGTALAPATGTDLFKALINDSAVVANDYSRGQMVWVMNDKTYKHIIAESLAVNAAGALVAGVNATMPVVGGAIEVLNFMPDNVIAFGYFDMYLLAERAGRQFASSEHVRFLQDQIVYKGTARYDGAPIIRESFGLALLDGATFTLATDIVFPQDTANPDSSI